MKDLVHAKMEDLPRTHKNAHPGYECYQRSLFPKDQAGKCMVAMYEIPPGKSAYPYHYHTENEEVFYILSGQGTLRTPAGERPVGPGEILFFPPNAQGAHKLTNASETEMLVYLDFDVLHDLEVAFYPDSGKVGIWGKGIDKVYQTKDSVDYYENE